MSEYLPLLEGAVEALVLRWWCCWWWLVVVVVVLLVVLVAMVLNVLQ
jgi:hypothetical protein